MGANITSAGHRMVPVRRLHISDGHRAIWFKHLIALFQRDPPGTARCYIQAPTSARTIVNTQEKILKKRPLPGRLTNSPVICKSLKLYPVSFICDHSIKLLRERFELKSQFFFFQYHNARTLKKRENYWSRVKVEPTVFDKTQ